MISKETLIPPDTFAVEEEIKVSNDFGDRYRKDVLELTEKLKAAEQNREYEIRADERAKVRAEVLKKLKKSGDFHGCPEWLESEWAKEK